MLFWVSRAPEEMLTYGVDVDLIVSGANASVEAGV